MKLMLKYLICTGAFAAVQALFPARVTGGIWQLAAAGLVLFIINLLIRPLAQLLCLPATILSVGLCYIAVDALMVGLTDAILPGIHTGGFWIWLAVAVITAIGNAALFYILNKRRQKNFERQNA